MADNAYVVVNALDWLTCGVDHVRKSRTDIEPPSIDLTRIATVPPILRPRQFPFL